MEYLVHNDFGRRAHRRDRTIYQRIFSTGEALLQIFAGVDERVFYLRDSFPESEIPQLAFGLFANWVPHHVDVTGTPPELNLTSQPSPTSTPFNRNRRRSQSRANSGTTLDEYAPLSPVIESTALHSEQSDENERDKSESNARRPSPRRTRSSDEDIPDSYERTTRRESRDDSYGGGAFYPGLGIRDPAPQPPILTAIPPPPTSFTGSFPSAFFRYPGLDRDRRDLNFEEFSVIKDMNDLFDERTSLPHDLRRHDTRDEEWKMFIAVSAVIYFVYPTLNDLIH